MPDDDGQTHLIMTGKHACDDGMGQQTRLMLPLSLKAWVNKPGLDELIEGVCWSVERHSSTVRVERRKVLCCST